MKIVFLFGGFGNQLFQVSKAVSIKVDSESVYYLDASGAYAVQHSSGVDRLLDIHIVRSIFVIPLFYLVAFSSKLSILRYLFRITIDGDECRSSLFLYGYFQSDQIASSSLEKIRALVRLNIFQPPVSFQNYGAIHIRRGDFFTPASPHAVLNVEWYRNVILNKLSVTSRKLIVVTDDVVWASENFCGSDIVIQSSADFLEDFLVLLFATDRIISNSTFSYWADKLAPIAGKTFAPSVWYKYVETSTLEIYNKDWILVDVEF
jgi:hypothetical protein